MLCRPSQKHRLYGRIAFYSAVLALLWIMEKVDAGNQANFNISAAPNAAPIVQEFLAQNLSH